MSIREKLFHLLSENYASWDGSQRATSECPQDEEKRQHPPLSRRPTRAACACVSAQKIQKTSAVRKARRQKLCHSLKSCTKAKSFYHSDEMLLVLLFSWFGEGREVTNPTWSLRRNLNAVQSVEKEWWSAEKGPKDQNLTGRRGKDLQNHSADRATLCTSLQTEAAEPVKWKEQCRSRPRTGGGAPDRHGDVHSWQ